jgi:LysM repeat protein
MNPKLKPKWSATKASVDSGATTYKVQAGNTLGQIVADYNKKNGTALKWQDVAKWNGIADPSKMRIGHVINFADPT